MPREIVTTELGEDTEADFHTRISFLHWAIEDSQNTVRFLDTKAAFCVTLLSGMVAVSLQHPLHGDIVKHFLFPAFMVIVACALLICLRVIFPTIIPHGSSGPPSSPKFFISHTRDHKWIRTTIRNPRRNILSETHKTYVDSLLAGTDQNLMSSMAETVVTIAFIRQVKADRLHSAMYLLGTAIFLFAAVMLTQL